MDIKDDKGKTIMIFVTGTSGFVGSSLIAELSRNGFEYVSFGRNRPKVRENLNYFKGDVCVLESIRKCFKKYQPDTVIHLANVITPSLISDFEKINVFGMENLISVSEEFEVDYFIYLSSLNVKLVVKNAYSLSKEKSEHILQKARIRKKLILRPSVIFGPEDKGYIGKLINKITMHKIIFCPVGGGPKLQPIYVSDLISKIISELNNKNSAISAEIFCAGNEIFNYRDLIDRVASCLNKSVRVVKLPFGLIRIVFNIANFFFPHKFEVYIDRLRTFQLDKIITRNDRSYVGQTSICDYLRKWQNRNGFSQ